MSFLYSLFTFLQPGVLWPNLAQYKPIILVSALAIFFSMIKSAEFERSFAFKNIALKYLVGFVIIQIISVYYSGASSLVQHFLFWYKYIAFILVSILVITSLKDINRYIYGILFGGEVVVLYGIASVIYDLPSSVGGKAGAYGMYENHNDYTFIIIMMVPFAYMLRKTTESGFMKLILTFMLLSHIVGILFSLSRGGMVALVFELGMLYIFTSEKKIGFFKLAFMGMIALSALVYQFSARDELQGATYTSEDSKSSRLELWKAGKNMVIAHPLLGVGSLRFGEFSRDYGEISHDNWGKNSHNTYIEIIATSGILGFLAFIGFLKHIIRQLRDVVKNTADKKLMAYAIATQVSLYSILIRSFFDAKNYDWSFYTLSVLAISIYAYYLHTKEAQDQGVFQEN